MQPVWILASIILWNSSRLIFTMVATSHYSHVLRADSIVIFANNFNGEDDSLLRSYRKSFNLDTFCEIPLLNDGDLCEVLDEIVYSGSFTSRHGERLVLIHHIEKDTAIAVPAENIVQEVHKKYIFSSSQILSWKHLLFIYFTPFFGELYLISCFKGKIDSTSIMHRLHSNYLMVLFYCITSVCFAMGYILYEVVLNIHSLIYLRRRNASFMVISVLEMFESVPQLLLQIVLYHNSDGNNKDLAAAFFISVSFSCIGIIKALYNWYSHFNVLRTGFDRSRGLTQEQLFISSLENLDIDSSKKRVEILRLLPEYDHALIQNSHAIELCMENGDISIFEFLVEEVGCDLNSKSGLAHIAASEGHKHLLKGLHRYGYDIDQTDIDGMLPFHMASLSGSVECLEYLYNFSDLKLQDNYGETAAHLAAKKGHVHALKFLHSRLYHTFENSDNCGKTPVHAAAKAGRLGSLRILRRLGCDFSVREEDGKTAAHYTCEKGWLDCLHYLFEIRCDLAVEDNDGHKPLDYAYSCEHEKCARFLEEVSDRTFQLADRFTTDVQFEDICEIDKDG